MSSAISCIVIKSDRLPKKIPVAGEIVKVENRSGLFVVMDIDQKSRTAQLMEKSGKHRLLDVPIGAIQTFNRNLARTINRFLESGAVNKIRKK